MAEAKDNVERGEYVIGIAIIFAALLVCATVYVGLGNVQSSVAGIKLGTVAGDAPSNGNAKAVAPETLKPKIEKFIDDNFLAQGFSANIVSIGPYDDYLYFANMSIEGPNSTGTTGVPVYITKDGSSVIIGTIAYKTDQMVPKKPSAPSAQGSAGTNAAPAVPAGNWSYLSSLPYVGPSNAKVTVAIFTDPQCPYCEVAEGREFGGSNLDALRGVIPKIVSEYASTGKAKVVYSVMAFLGQESSDAANAEYCARNISGDSGFLKMHDKLTAVHTGSEGAGTYSKANLTAYAAEIGFNTPAMAKCISSGAFDPLVLQTTANANAVGVQGTPTIAVNNQIVTTGGQSDPTYAAVKAAIEKALAN